MKTLSYVFALILVLTSVGCGDSNSSTTTGGNTPAPSPTPVDPRSNEEIDFEYMGMIREFGGVDNAALFVLRTEVGEFKVTRVAGPRFIKALMVGPLDQARADRLFTKGSRPLAPSERAALLSKYQGATVLYAEGYEGNICNDEELKYRVIAGGTVNGQAVEVTFVIVALPNPTGNCKFHIFGIETRTTN